jgi:AcrR family transcriptional regulator
MSKKQEIIDRALDRFQQGGFHATGIDAVMADTGISKRTLYKYFPSKEDLIEAVLEQYGCDAEDALFAPAMARSNDPREKIAAIFDVRRELMETGGCYRGCLAMRAAQEFAGKHDGITARGQASADYVEARFAELAAAAGVADPKEAGRRINLLFQGAVLTSQMRRDTAAFESAKAMLRDLLA